MNRNRWLLAIVIAIVAGGFAILPRSPGHSPPKDFWPPASQYMTSHQGQAVDSRSTSRYVRMRDGVRIAVTTTMPSTVREGQRAPVVLRIARYWRQWDIRWPASVLAQDPQRSGAGLAQPRIRAGKRGCARQRRLFWLMAVCLLRYRDKG